MAHFEDDRFRRVSGQTLPVRVGFVRTLYLWGGDGSGGALNVTSSHPGVLRITEDAVPRGTPPHYRKFTIRAAADADTVQVFCTPTGGSSPWDIVNFIVLTSAESGVYYRNRLMSIAASHLGAHYLWGAAGARPGQLDGMPGRPGSVFMLTSPIDSGDIVHSVAGCNVAGRNTCAGKPWTPGQPDSPAYAQSVSDMSAETSGRSYRTVHTAYRTVKKPGTILGERCDGKRHFDCVGFINYCLSAAFGEGYQFEICGAERDGYRGYANRFPAVTGAGQAGDILIFGGRQTARGDGTEIHAGGHHIGFDTGDGNMIHASETEYGVVRTGIGRDLSRRIRHPRLS
jgi:hypothetical protein